MAQGPDGNTIIIVKKVSGHAGHHGGAWKVAYADFVTAMMALFMVLWLVNSASVSTREKIASYFKRPGIFEKGSGTPLEIGGSGILSESFAPPGAGSSRLVPTDEVYDAGEPGGLKEEGFVGGQENIMDKGGEGEAEKVAAQAALKHEMEAFSRIRQQLEQVFGGEGEGGAEGLLGQLQIKLDRKGLHLEIMDTPTASMFSLGSPRIKKEAEAELLVVAKIIVQLPNPVDLEGHTDSRPFRNKQRRYDNWDLSIDRANSARRVLAKAGMRKWQISRVVGYSDRRPKVADDPMHPSNRRISISMRFTEQAAKALRETSAIETRSVRIRRAVSGGEATKKPVPPVAVEPEAKETVTKQPVEASGSVAQVEVEAKKDNGLKMEVSTSNPEGEAMSGPDDYEASGNPQWRQKDRIFGGENPFFK